MMRMVLIALLSFVLLVGWWVGVQYVHEEVLSGPRAAWVDAVESKFHGVVFQLLRACNQSLSFSDHQTTCEPFTPLGHKLHLPSPPDDTPWLAVEVVAATLSLFLLLVGIVWCACGERHRMREQNHILQYTKRQ
jgi:hypothetical protein